jgi:hypothetical protein
MILLALMAASVAATTAPPSAAHTAEPMPNLYREPAHCNAVLEREVARQHVAFRGPPPIIEYAVARRIDGCGVPTPVGYHPTYLLPGAADPTPKREDAPSRKR